MAGIGDVVRVLVTPTPRVAIWPKPVRAPISPALPSLQTTLSTRAIDGPRCAHSNSASTASTEPLTSASTLPSRRLRTQPVRPRRSASAQSDQR